MYGYTVFKVEFFLLYVIGQSTMEGVTDEPGLQENVRIIVKTIFTHLPNLLEEFLPTICEKVSKLVLNKLSSKTTPATLQYAQLFKQTNERNQQVQNDPGRSQNMNLLNQHTSSHHNTLTQIHPSHILEAR